MLKRSVKQGLSAVGTAAVCVLVGWLVFRGYQTEILTDSAKMEVFVQSLGFFAPLGLLLLQMLQILLSFIPGGVTLAAGVVCFGAVRGFFLNYLGIVLGSCLNFWLARRFGTKIVQTLASEKLYEKTNHWLQHKRFDAAFAIAILLPFFPDDFLCMVAGLSPMRFRRFLQIILFCKPLSILLYSLGYSGVLTILPYFQ